MSEIDKANENLADYVHQCRYFSFLSREKILHLLPQFEKIELKKGQFLFRQGDEPEFLYILLEGKLIAYLEGALGKSKVIGAINPIETVGELGALSGELRTLSIEVVTNSILLKVKNSLFKELCQEFPPILEEVTKLLVERSIKTIKLMAFEKISRTVSVIFPITQKYNPESLKSKISHNINDEELFIQSDGISTEEIITLIRRAESENKHMIIFMQTWNIDIFEYFRDKLVTLFTVAHEDEKVFFNEFNKHIFNSLSQYENIRLELVLFHPENSTHILNTRKWLQVANFALHHHIRKGNASDFKRFIRFLTGKACVLVLGGGGVKGLAHLGVIKALTDQKVPIDAIGGTSIGAAIGACYAATLSYKKTLGYVNKLKNAGIRSVSYTNVTWPVVSIYSSTPGTKAIIEVFENACIEDLLIPYFAISSNLNTNSEEIHRSGLVWEAVRSSVAIPGIFPPVVFNGQLLVDGGLLNNLPVEIMREFVGQNHLIIASSLSKRNQRNDDYNFSPALSLRDVLLWKTGFSYQDNVYPHFFEMFLDSLLLGSYASELKNCRQVDILIKPDLADFKILTYSEESEEILITAGYNETIKEVNKYNNRDKK